MKFDAIRRVLWVHHVGLLTPESHLIVRKCAAREVEARCARAIISDFRQAIMVHDLSAVRVASDAVFARLPIALLVQESAIDLFRQYVVDSVRRGSVRGIFTDACSAFAWSLQMAALLDLAQRSKESGDTAG